MSSARAEAGSEESLVAYSRLRPRRQRGPRRVGRRTQIHFDGRIELDVASAPPARADDWLFALPRNFLKIRQRSCWEPSPTVVALIDRMCWRLALRSGDRDSAAPDPDKQEGHLLDV